MRWLAASFAVLLLVGPAEADNCDRSRTYILEGLAGDLALPPADYQHLFKVCLETLTLDNVKDAYVLKDGGIAVLPLQNSVIATAETLARFCERFPKSTARFISPRERKKWPTVGLIVLLSSTGVASCKQIRGMT